MPKVPNKSKTFAVWAKELPKSELIQWLLDNPTASDKLWTKRKRKKNESRADFIQRIVG